jgi:hypothetical protein
MEKMGDRGCKLLIVMVLRDGNGGFWGAPGLSVNGTI